MTRVKYGIKEFVERHASVVDGAAVVVTDGNLPPEGLREVARLCARRGVPLVFEPTSVAKCSVPFSARVSLRTHLPLAYRPFFYFCWGLAPLV